MKLRRKLLLIMLQIAVLLAAVYLLPGNYRLLVAYDRFIFYPFQSLRGTVFGLLGFSLGDIIYVLWGIGLLITLIKWIGYIFRFGTCKERLAASFLDAVNAVLSVYLFFLFGWGANYYKPSLAKSWDLALDSKMTESRDARRKTDSTILVSFDRFLVDKLNTYAPHYHYSSFARINEHAKSYYQEYTDSKVRFHGLGIKPSLFTYFLELMAVDGYYNPFTGEGQANTSLPSFLMPFLLCHEMAHQAGIAAEGDANLMAYALGTAVGDSSFNYSAYLNIWLYTHHRLYRRDSAMANTLEKQLNPLTTAHLDTLDQLSRKYNTDLTKYSAEIYDDYLKVHQQKDGLRSYGNVVTSAWLLEQKRTKGVIHVP
jgi:uncharacterized protein DUF3810